MCSITDAQLDQAAELIERHVRDVLASGSLRYLGDACVHATEDILKLWNIGFISADPELSEPPRVTPN